MISLDIPGEHGLDLSIRVSRRGGMTAEELAKHFNVPVAQIEQSLLRLIGKSVKVESVP